MTADAVAFEGQRPRLKTVAYRMLGSLTDADDAVQDTWIRFSRTDTREVDNLRGWLTTVVTRVCLNMLRSRTTRREAPLDAHVPDPVITLESDDNPERQALLTDSVGLASQVVLDSLPPAERVAFVLHDMFGMTFDEIAPLLDRSPTATRQLASRARRRVRTAPTPDRDLARQREVVTAFFAAARGGDFNELVAVLHPDVVVQEDAGAGVATTATVQGAEAVAGRALMFSDPRRVLVPVLVNGAAGVVVTLNGQATAVMAFTVTDGKITAISALTDPKRLAHLDLGV
ncbi:MAG: sigma-70 family RNA polymerase sigma factor [Vicinamibacteraceae bacterium]